MGKIAFFCIPAHGHTNPTLGVVKELVKSGHEVRYYSYNSMKEKIQNTGAEYISCDPYDQQTKMKPEDADRVSKDLKFSIGLLVDMTLALDEALLEDMKTWNPDCIVADSMAVWGKLVAQKLQKPFISSTTTFAFNKYSARIMKQDTKEMLRMIIILFQSNRVVKRLRDKGYPVKSALELISNDNDTNTIVYTSKEFQPFSDTFSDKYAFVGPSIRSVQPGSNLYQKGLIYISLGTVVTDNLPFFKTCLKVLKGSSRQVVMSIGNRINREDLGEIPANFIVEESVDQIAVLQHADLFLTHCGMNSINEALYYEVPLVLYPQTKEQEGVAKRVYDMGAGIYLESSDADAIVNAIQEISKNTNYRKNAKMISESFHRCGGAKQAAEKILEVAGLADGRSNSR